jgi:hypothetical protein
LTRTGTGNAAPLARRIGRAGRPARRRCRIRDRPTRVDAHAGAGLRATV